MNVFVLFHHGIQTSISPHCILSYEQKLIGYNTYSQSQTIPSAGVAVTRDNNIVFKLQLRNICAGLLSSFSREITDSLTFIVAPHSLAKSKANKRRMKINLSGFTLVPEGTTTGFSPWALHNLSETSRLDSEMNATPDNYKQFNHQCVYYIAREQFWKSGLLFFHAELLRCLTSSVVWRKRERNKSLL